MIVKNLTMKSFCGVESYYTEFEKLAFVDTKYAEAVLLALGVLLDNFEITCGKVSDNEAELTALVELLGEEYTLRYRHGRNTAYRSNTECTDSFYKSIRTSREEQAVTVFDSTRDQNFPKRLWEYSEMLENGVDSIFDNATDGIGLSLMFRKELKRMINEFKPQTFAGKEIILDKSGRFKVLAEGMLSAEDVVLYNCYCFFKVAQFWQDVAYNKDIHRVKMPLFISNVLSRIDETKPRAAILAEAKKADRQVFFFDER